MEEAARMLGALLVVLAIILALGWVLRRFSNAAGARTRAHSDLKILEWKPMDARRKLAVVRWDGRDHLLCLGPGGDCVVAHREAEPDETGQTSTAAPAKSSLVE
ncbi:MAG: flagellar biosynthetic protein FliO [Pseudomonadota bacterium]